MKTKRILSVTIIIGFIITMIVIQIDRKIHERDMYESEIKGILWKIVLKKEDIIIITISIIKGSIL